MVKDRFTGTLGRYLTAPIAVALIFGCVVFAFESNSYAESNYCVVVSLQNNAWVTRKDATVKSSLKLGDVLYPGDRLEVFHGNSVDIAFDRESMNILHIKGETHLEITSIGPTDVQLNDRKGEVFALWDNRKSITHFQISTPTAVAAVRGTQFSVSHVNNNTFVSTFEGAVRVHGKNIDGSMRSDYVTVSAGEKTEVKGLETPPTTPVKMSSFDMRSIEGVRDQAENVRSWLKDNSAVYQPDKTREERQRQRKSSIDVDEVTKSKEGVILF